MSIINIINEELSRFINETSLNAIDYNSFRHLIKDSDELPYIATEYGYTVDSDNVIEIIKSEDFNKWLHNEFNVVVDRLKKVTPPNGKINIWRMMSVSDKWLDDLPNTNTRLGIYWTWDEEALDTYWDELNGNPVILESSVDGKHVNWIDTILTNIQFSTEKEIRLFKNTPLKPVKIYDIQYNNILDTPEHPQLKDKTFYA